MRSAWLAVAVIACSSTPALDPAVLQMNDLSVLLPLPRTQAELAAALAPATMGRGGELVPRTTFETATVFLTYDRFRATAFRVDPCFGHVGEITDPTTCHGQLRLVFQPVAVGTTDDIAVHAFYALTGDEVLALVGELAAARRDDGITTDLGPLAVHPILASEGLDGPFAHAFDQIVTRYAGAANLERLNTFAIEEIDVSQGFVASQTWTFTSFDTLGTPAPRPIPTIANGPNEMTLTTDLAPLIATSDPATSAHDNLAVLANMTMATSASSGTREAALDAALRIESPTFHSPETIDCASCHLARAAIELVGEPLGLDEDRDAAFAASDAIPGRDLARTTSLTGNDRGLNIHAFSYRLAEPMINQRTINETAANLAYFASH